jgi:hypothetical protein
MSELKRQDIISDDALMAPLVLAKNLEQAHAAIMKIIKSGKDSSDAIGNAKNTTKLKEETEKLTREQQELVKIQKQIATAVAKDTEAYRKYEKQLASVKKETKAKVELGDRDAKQVTKHNSSLAQLTVALNKNRAAYAALRTEEERGSKAGKELLAIVQQQDKEVKELRESMGQFQDSVGNYAGAMQGLKKELKDARDELAGIAATLGESSEEYRNAAVKVGELQDKIGDLNEAGKAVSGEPIEKMAGSFDMLVGKLRAADFKGATVAVKQFTAASREMTFRQAIQGIGGFTKALLSMGRAILTNPLFLLAGTIITIVVAINKLKDSLIPLRILFDGIGNGVDWVTTKLKGLSDQLGLSRFEAEEAALKRIEASKKEVAAIQAKYDREIALAGRAGKDVAEKEKMKQEAVVAYYSAALAAYDDLQIGHRKLTDEEIKDIEDIKEARKEALNEIKVAEFDALDERLDRIRMASESSIRLNEVNTERLLNAQDEQYNKGLISLERAELRKQKILRDSAIEQAKIQIANGNKIIDELMNSGLLDSNSPILAEAIDAVSKAENQLTALTEDSSKHALDSTILTLENLKGHYESFASSIGGIFSSITENRLADLEKLSKAEDDRLNRQLELVGNNEEAKKILQDRSEKRQAELERRKIAEQRKAAIFDKATSAVQAAIATALAITKALPNIPLSIAVGVAGAANVAAILAKNIPQYEKGGITSKRNIIAGEAGTELFRTPSGQYGMTPATATLMDLPVGTEIFNHEETVRMLALNGIMDMQRNDRPQGSRSEESRILRDIHRAIVSQSSPDYAKVGNDIYEVKKYKDGSKRYIRSKNING